MTRPLYETLDETRNILLAFRDALISSRTVSQMPDGMARLVAFRDDKVDLLVQRATINVYELSEHLGKLAKEAPP